VLLVVSGSAPCSKVSFRLHLRAISFFQNVDALPPRAILLWVRIFAIRSQVSYLELAALRMLHVNIFETCIAAFQRVFMHHVAC
jgi:hypothetical protein